MLILTKKVFMEDTCVVKWRLKYHPPIVIHWADNICNYWYHAALRYCKCQIFSEILTLKPQKDVSLPALTAEIHSKQFGGRLLALPDNVCSVSSTVSDIQYGQWYSILSVLSPLQFLISYLSLLSLIIEVIFSTYSLHMQIMRYSGGKWELMTWLNFTKIFKT
jgi:hypothetical protein